MGIPASRPKPTYTKIQGTFQRETDKAILFQVEKVLNGSEDGKEIDPKKEWFPKSQVTVIYKDPIVAGLDILNCSDWILQTKGII